MTDDPLTRFVRKVKGSTLLSPAQKREFLDRPELLPEGYRETVLGILDGFEGREQIRYEGLRERVVSLLTEFETELDRADIPSERKRALMETMTSQVAGLLRNQGAA